MYKLNATFVEKGNPRVYSLYPSFVACLCLFSFTCIPAGMTCIRCLGIKPWVFRIFNVLYLAGLVLHFIRPSWDLYWLPVILFCLFHLVCEARLRMTRVAQVLLIGAAAQSLVEYVVAWYPYPDWRGIPLYMLFTAAWCLMARVFHDNMGTALTQVVAICGVGLIREYAHTAPEHMLSNPVHVLKDGILLCNVFWTAMSVFVVAVLTERVWENFKVRKFRVI